MPASVCQVGPAAGRGQRQRGSHGSSDPDASGDEEDAWEARLLKPLPVCDTTFRGKLFWQGPACLGLHTMVWCWALMLFPTGLGSPVCDARTAYVLCCGTCKPPPFLHAGDASPACLRVCCAAPADYSCSACSRCLLCMCAVLCLQTTLLGELRQLGAAISQDIFQESPNVKWTDIAGLADAKR